MVRTFRPLKIMRALRLGELTQRRRLAAAMRAGAQGATAQHRILRAADEGAAALLALVSAALPAPCDSV